MINLKLKSILLAMAAVLLVAFAPSAASAEPVLDPSEADLTVIGSSGNGGLFTPFTGGITCESVDVSGTVNTGGKSGSLTFDMTGCHYMSLGFTHKCQSLPAPLSNTIQLTGSFETTYLTDDKTKPGIKFTIASTPITCFAPTVFATLSGSVLGTLSTPECGAGSSKVTFNFVGWENQVHRQITGTGASITLKATSPNGTEASAGLTVDLGVEFSKITTITCV